MAGFQQAANAITSSFGTVAGKVGIYNELVGKNQKLIGELKTANKSLEESNEKITGLNEELDKKNEELGEKNAKLQDFYDTARKRQEWEFQMDKEAAAEEEAKKEAAKEHRKINKELNIKRGAMAERKLDVQLAHASKNMMINSLYGDFASGSGGGI